MSTTSVNICIAKNRSIGKRTCKRLSKISIEVRYVKSEVSCAYHGRLDV